MAMINRLLTTVVTTLALLPTLAATVAAAPAIKKTEDTVVEPQALTLRGRQVVLFGDAINGKAFQQDAMVTHNGYQYVAYYNARRRVALSRRHLPRGEWETIEFTDYLFRSNDAHNIISMGICPRDGTIHLAFDHHGHPLHYRVSKKNLANQPDEMPWNADQFGRVRNELEPGKPIAITYPRFWTTPDGDLQFAYRQGRSGNGMRMLVDYRAGQSRWINTRQIDSPLGSYQDDFCSPSESRCSYPNGYTYGPNGRLHVTWVWREGGSTPNHDLSYMYSDNQGHTWHSSNGDVLDQPARVDTPDVRVARIDCGQGLMNTAGQAVDSAGRIHAVLRYCSREAIAAAGAEPGGQRWGPAEARRYHHHWRDTRGVWHHVEIPFAATSRPKIAFDREDNLLLVATAAGGINPPAKELQRERRHGDLLLLAATAASDWTDWRVLRLEPGPFANEMLLDSARWKAEQVLSVMVQEAPMSIGESTPLRVIDFEILNP